MPAAARRLCPYPSHPVHLLSCRWAWLVCADRGCFAHLFPDPAQRPSRLGAAAFSRTTIPQRPDILPYPRQKPLLSHVGGLCFAPAPRSRTLPACTAVSRPLRRGGRRQPTPAWPPIPPPPAAATAPKRPFRAPGPLPVEPVTLFLYRRRPSPAILTPGLVGRLRLMLLLRPKLV